MFLSKLVFGLVALAFSFPAVADHHANIVGPDACMECHEAEGAAWQNTHHFMTFKKLHKRKKAKKIAKAMGVKKIKREPTCAQCHYTTKAGKKKPLAGISCESCHGGAKNWIEVHNDYGGKNAKKADETAANKAKRIKASIAGGMIRPENIYDVASNCFACHTVPNEKLVNVGGHKAGSDFELVSWSQGEVRHGAPASAERKRVLYIAGRVLDLEYGLRGLANATGGEFKTAMTARVKAALGHVAKIKDATGDATIAKIHSLGAGAAGKGKGAIMKAVKGISAAGKKLLNGNDGKAFAGVDGLIPTDTKGSSSY